MSEPTDAETRAALDDIREQRANCPVCRASRELWHAVMDASKDAIDGCCGFDNPPCRACGKLHEARSAWGLADIYTTDAHPHTEKIAP